VIGCMGIFIRDSIFIDSLEYFHKCVKKEKRKKEKSLSFLRGEGHKWTKEMHCKKKGERQ
jgi:hypothetical protein